MSDIIELPCPEGKCTIYREVNTEAGGYTYYSNSCGDGYRVIDTCLTSIAELEVIINDMKRMITK